MNDLAAAVQELSDRVQHRTAILGTALENMGNAVIDLQTGQGIMKSGMEQFQSELRHQQAILSELVQRQHESNNQSAQHDREIHVLREHLEASHHTQQVSQVQLDKGVQLQAVLAARVEQLEGQVQRLLSASGNHPVSDASRDQATINMEFQAMQAEIQHLNVVLEKKEREEQTNLEWQHSLQEMMADTMVRVEALEKVSGPQVYQMSPEPQGTDPTEDTQIQDGTMAWLTCDEPANMPAAGDDAVGWWTDGQAALHDPPTLPPGLSKAASSTHDVEPVPDAASKVPEVPNGKWKLLMDLPMFVRATGEPWEVSIQYNTWKRKLLAVCEIVCSAFAKFVSGQFASAHQRHEAQMAGSARQPYEEVPNKCKEYEARLVVGLLRFLPQDVKNGAVEDTNVSITSIKSSGGVGKRDPAKGQGGGRRSVALCSGLGSCKYCEGGSGDTSSMAYS